MKVGIVAAGLLVGAMGIAPLAAEAASFSEVYEFGDSLLDTGNLFAITSGPLPPGSPPPSAVPFPGPPYPGAPYFNGRFSNGPLWHEYVEQGLGVAFDPSTNFAFSGALSGTLHSQFPAPLGLRSQVTGFTSSVGSADPNALYILSAGANDYGNPFVVTPQTIADAVENITNSIVDLASVGASSFLVLTIPNLGLTPAGSIAPGPLASISAAHNAALTSSVNALNANPALDILLLDVNTIFDAAVANPSAFGFTNVSDPCFDIATLTTCANPDEYLFWDFTHPTAAAHEILGEFALAELRAAHVPEPTTALGLVAVGALGAARRWQQQRDRRDSDS